MDQEHPLITVGMPVRNEARFLASALEAMTAQRGVRYEIVVSDNASTDATPEICRDFVARFPKLVRYHRFDENVGASANFAWLLEQASGEFFMWASGHDLWDDDYLLGCSRLLEATPTAMIAFGNVDWIDENGQPFGRATGWSDTRGLSLPARYCTVLWGSMNPIIGLIRTRALKEHEFNDMVAVDLAILLALSLRGDFVHCTSTSWRRREYRHEASFAEKLERYRSADYALSTSWLGRTFPLARLPLRIFGDLYRSGIGFGYKLGLTLILLASLPVKYVTDKARRQTGRP
jgi:glycosyltransferase involved in cell wall biosynthesis